MFNKGEFRIGEYTQLKVTDRRRLFIFIEMGLSAQEIALKLSIAQRFYDKTNNDILRSDF